jgi:RimJ/RimL family protein N-acetyltransferase
MSRDGPKVPLVTVRYRVRGSPAHAAPHPAPEIDYAGRSMSDSLSSADAFWALEWRSEDELLMAIEPTDQEIAGAAPDLAAYYNDRHNRQMMGHEDEPFTAAAVATYYRELRAGGGRPFLLQRGRAEERSLVGDADLRNIEDGVAEVAIMIGGRQVQGRGLGTRYATMLHVFAFRVLGLDRLYISVVPANAASRRLFGKLGYEIDDSPEARELIDEETDLTLSVSRARFEGICAASLREVRAHRRSDGQNQNQK